MRRTGLSSEVIGITGDTKSPLDYLDIVTSEVKSIAVGTGSFRYIYKIYKISVASIRGSNVTISSYIMDEYK